MNMRDDILIKLTNLMDGLEIPLSAIVEMPPEFFLKVGQAIATQAKKAPDASKT